jgi:hypothetical protein
MRYKANLNNYVDKKEIGEWGKAVGECQEDRDAEKKRFIWG